MLGTKVGAIFASTTAILIASATLDHSSAQGLKTWRHGVVDPKGDAGFSAMVGQAGFAQKQDLKVEVVALKDGALAHKALLAGEVDSIESSPGGAILAGAQGADIKIVGCDWLKVPHGLMVRSNIASVQDLKGRTVAVSAPGSLPNMVIAAILDIYQVPPSEVRLASMGGDQPRFKAWLAGILDAGIVAGEFMAIAPPEIKLLLAGREVLPNYVRNCLTMSGRTAAERRDEAVRFVAAEIDALRYALSHRDETIKLTQEIIAAKLDDPRPAFAFDDTVKNASLDPSVPLPMDRLEWMQNELVKVGNLHKRIDLAKIVDAGIRAKAMERLGN